MFFQLDDRRVIAEGDYFVAPGAILIGSVVLKHNANVWFNAVLRGDVEPITVGSHSNVQDCAVLHTDPGCPLIIGDYVTVGHKAMLHGCEIGENSLIGINTVVLNGAKIGRNCLIGANSLVTEGKIIPDNSMAIGTPARVTKELGPEQLASLRASAEHYVAKAHWYLAGCVPQQQADRLA